MKVRYRDIYSAFFVASCVRRDAGILVVVIWGKAKSWIPIKRPNAISYEGIFDGTRCV